MVAVSHPSRPDIHRARACGHLGRGYAAQHGYRLGGVLPWIARTAAGSSGTVPNESQDHPTISVSVSTAAPMRRKIDALFKRTVPDATNVAVDQRYLKDRDTVVLQATIDGQLVGGLVGHGPGPQIGRHLRVDETTSRVRVIAEMAVDPQDRRSGVGMALVREIEERFTAEGARLVIVFVDARSPESAGAFWSAAGYTKVPVLPAEAGQYRQVASVRPGRFYVKGL